MADVFDVKPGDRVRIVFEGTVQTVVARPSHPRVDILFKAEMGDDPADFGAGVYWFRGEFAPELVIYEKESEES